MTGKTDRVVLVKGSANAWYEQAIFIINPNSPENLPMDFVAEAEKIISDFNLTKLVKKEQFNPIITTQKPVETGGMVWGWLVIVASLVITAILAFGLLT